MDGNELKKLSRSDLLQMLIEQVKENDRLKAELEEKDKLLKDRTIKIQECGSIAEAALRLNGVFEAAQAAAQQYIDNVNAASHAEDYTRDVDEIADFLKKHNQNGKDENDESE
ncbi:MAG: DNA repair protein [Acutalibacteraceae bacterium]